MQLNDADARWLELAAAAGDAEAGRRLGGPWQRRGELTPRDPHRLAFLHAVSSSSLAARTVWERHAETDVDAARRLAVWTYAVGDRGARYRYESLVREGERAARSAWEDEEFPRWSADAEAGDVEAALRLGLALSRRREPDAALGWLRRAVEGDRRHAVVTADALWVGHPPRDLATRWTEDALAWAFEDLAAAGFVRSPAFLGIRWDEDAAPRQDWSISLAGLGASVPARAVERFRLVGAAGHEFASWSEYEHWSAFGTRVPGAVEEDVDLPRGFALDGGAGVLDCGAAVSVARAATVTRILVEELQRNGVREAVLAGVR